MPSLVNPGQSEIFFLEPGLFYRSLLNFNYVTFSSWVVCTKADTMFCLRSGIREATALTTALKASPALKAAPATALLRGSNLRSKSIDTDFWRGNGEMGVPSLHGDLPKPAFRDEDRKSGWRSQTDAIDRNATNNVSLLLS